MINSSELFDKEWIINKAKVSLNEKPRHITDAFSKLSEGGLHDFYSNGDYWWPNSDTLDGLPYVCRDGQSNPNAFFEHRVILRKLRTNVANLSAGYLVTGNEDYAEKAVLMLKEFFIDEVTKMNPNLLYTQAIPGVCSGRGIGIIDTLHLIEIPVAIQTLSKSPFLTEKVLFGLKQWFSEYLKWMTTHEFGIKEMNEYNNHGVTWNVQAAVFARFTENTHIQDLCRERYKKILLPNQMALNGSFPAELKRTKPYSYSIFVLDNMVTICHVLSKPEDNLWEFQLEDGRSIRKGIEFLYPYLEDKSKWPFRQDVEHFEAWPVAVSSLLFAGYGLSEGKYIKLWKRLEKHPIDDEVRRNIAIRQPALWL
ncbi:MAG TPA: alginate lyase family protein [Clostridiaceae bacterium]